jgi:hypothetical protein
MKLAIVTQTFEAERFTDWEHQKNPTGAAAKDF